MAGVKPSSLTAFAYSAFIGQCRMLSISTPLAANPLFVRNRFKMMSDLQKERPVPASPTKAKRSGESQTHAHRKPYIRPKIKLWPTFKEIPYHYREGKNKALLIPSPKKTKIKKYKNFYEERSHYRSAFQRLMNRGQSLIPYDKKMPVITGKHTGPGVEGGSELAQKLAALHLVQPTGYVNRVGNFKQVKEMIPEFVVPNLDDCKLKPYVSYRATEINQSKFTARTLYNAFYGEEAQKKFEEETGIKTNLELKQTVKKSSIWKKS